MIAAAAWLATLSDDIVRSVCVSGVLGEVAKRRER